MTLDVLMWGLRMGVITSVLIGLVLFVRRPFVKYFGAEATFLLWSLPALRMLMPDIHLPVKESLEILPFDTLAFQEMEMFLGQTSTPITNVPTIINPVKVANQIHINPLSFIVFIWLAGGVLWASYHLWPHYKYTRLLRDVSFQPAASLTPMLERACALIGLKHQPRIMIAPKNIGPLVSGVINPLVILPQNFEEDYSERGQLFALCHEMAHIKRRDVWWVLALLMFRAAHWYNPLVHYAARKFRLDQEAACDAHTLSKFGKNGADAHDYAMTLLMNEQSNFEHADNIAAMPALSLAFTETSKGAFYEI